MLTSDRGYFGKYGGAFVPEILHQTIKELQAAFLEVKEDQKFWQDYLSLMSSYSCRPTPLTYCENLSDFLGGARIYLKREDLGHTGAHKVNNVMGQGLLTKRMGKSRVIAETGAGQHGVATATMAAKFGLKCRVYMGAKDCQRQYPNVFWMKKLGAEVIPVSHGGGTLKDAIDDAMRDWSASFADTHYVLGTACGPHPFPEMVAWFQSIIGTEARQQILAATGKLPHTVYACVGGGSNALGMFAGFLADAAVGLCGVEAGGTAAIAGQHAARLASTDGREGICQGYRTVFLQDGDGQMLPTSSIAAGLDYTGVSPILAHLKDQGRVAYQAVGDAAVAEALQLLIAKEGIIPALESSHALAQAFADAASLSRDDVVLINLSGRGDKDIFTIAQALDDAAFRDYLQSRL